MTRLVFITQQVDPGHPALAATVPKLHALAQRVDELVVLADGAVPGALPQNARVRRFAAGTKVGRGLRFEAALASELRRRPRPDGIVAHMCPIYAVLAAPLARPLRVPLVLWYTHWHASPTLRAAAHAATAIASVDRRSFPLRSPKVRAIGHGIDVDEFPCRQHAAAEELRLLALGRYSPAKGLSVVFRALRRALDRGTAVRLSLHGPTLSPLEQAHRAELERLVQELRLEDRVALDGPVERARVPELLATHDALVNNMRAGAPDKVVYEAAASCVPVLASNPVFDTLLPDELRFERDDPAQLAERIAELAALNTEERARHGHALRQKVSREHSVETWAERILELAR
jgi:glycosyltransferase involved in cell wall biosynthesis